MEEHEVCSDSEFETRETLKLTARSGAGSAFRRDVSTSTRRPPSTRRINAGARDETTKEIQDEDEATLRELLIRYLNSDANLSQILLFNLRYAVCCKYEYILSLFL